MGIKSVAKAVKNKITSIVSGGKYKGDTIQKGPAPYGYDTKGNAVYIQAAPDSKTPLGPSKPTSPGPSSNNNSPTKGKGGGNVNINISSNLGPAPSEVGTRTDLSPQMSTTANIPTTNKNFVQKAATAIKNRYDDFVQERKNKAERAAQTEADATRLGNIDYSGTGNLPYQQRGTANIKTTSYTDQQLLERAGLDKGGSRIEYTRRVNAEIQNSFEGLAQGVYEKNAALLQQEFQERLNLRVGAIETRYVSGEISKKEYENQVNQALKEYNERYKREIENASAGRIEELRNVYEATYKAKIRKYNDAALINKSIVSIPLLVAAGFALPVAAGATGAVATGLGVGALGFDIANRVKMVKAGDISGRVAAGTLLIDTGSIFLGGGLGNAARARSQSLAINAALDRAKLKPNIKTLSLDADIKKLRLDPELENIIRDYRQKGFKVSIVETSLQAGTAADAKLLPKITARSIVITNSAGVIENSVSIGSIIAKKGKQTFSTDVIGDFISVRNNAEQITEGVLATGNNIKDLALKNVQRAYEEQRFLSTRMPELLNDLQTAEKVRSKARQELFFETTDVKTGKKTTMSSAQIDIFQVGEKVRKQPRGKGKYSLTDVAEFSEPVKKVSSGKVKQVKKELGTIAIEDASNAPSLFEKSDLTFSVARAAGEFSAEGPKKTKVKKPRIKKEVSVFDETAPGNLDNAAVTQDFNINKPSSEVLKDKPTMNEDFSMFGTAAEATSNQELLGTRSLSKSSQQLDDNVPAAGLDFGVIKDVARKVSLEQPSAEKLGTGLFLSAGSGLDQGQSNDFSLQNVGNDLNALSSSSTGQLTGEQQKPKLRTPSANVPKSELSLDFGFNAPTLEGPTSAISTFGFASNNDEGPTLESPQPKRRKKKNAVQAYQASLASIFSGTTKKVTRKEAEALNKDIFTGLEQRPQLEIQDESQGKKGKGKSIKRGKVFF